MEIKVYGDTAKDLKVGDVFEVVDDSSVEGRPRVILRKTTKGFGHIGVNFLENIPNE